MKTAGYPDWIEQWWLNCLRKRTGIQSLTDRHPVIERAIEQLTDLFTRSLDRERFDDYFSDESLLLAYGLFFFPRNFVRIQFPIVELLQRGWSVPENVRILDLGAGTGASAFGAAHQLKSLVPEISITLTAADHSASALAIFKNILEDAPLPYLSADTFPTDLKKIKIPGKFHIVILSFALNEFAEEIRNGEDRWIQVLMGCLEENGVILILEPAARDASERLERIRDRIAVKGEQYLWGPCLHHYGCPLLAGGKFWCHEVREWTPPQSLELMNRHFYRKITTLKYSFLLIGRNPAPSIVESPAHFRLIAPWIKGKGKWTAFGCAADGHRYQYEILQRNSSLMNRINSERGDLVCERILEPAGKGIQRIRSFLR
jgi:ribosomal protein RSM22 (predicted rRNA methylase)